MPILSGAAGGTSGVERLSLRTLAGVAPSVTLPPAAARVAEIGIVHLGLGAFHRAHQAIVTQRALAEVPGDWSISGASLRSPNVRDALFPQDGLYSVSADDGGGPALTGVGCLHEV